MKTINADRVDRFYKNYPDRFLEDILGVELYLYQKIYLRLMAKSRMAKTLACRGCKRR